MSAIPHPAPGDTSAADTARAHGADGAFAPDPADDSSPFDAAVAAFARDVVAPGAPLWERERRIGRETIEAGADFGFAFSLINTGNIATKLAREASAELVARWVPALMADAGARIDPGGCPDRGRPVAAVLRRG